ncbi:MAG: hypothetical protein ACOY0T_29700 [Myxococcota bacterium]
MQAGLPRATLLATLGVRALRTFTTLGALATLGCNTGDTLYIGVHSPPISDDAACNKPPSVPPTELKLDAFYRKYIDARGIPVLASESVDDRALQKACAMVTHMQPRDPRIWDAMIARKLRVSILARAEPLTRIPEYADLYVFFPDRDWDSMRGVGATSERPVSSVGEENLLCDANDRFAGEFILASSFSHGLRALGISPVDPTFPQRLSDAFDDARRAGLWDGTFAGSNPAQYFAEGVQDWFDANAEATPADGLHNSINTRSELKSYDPTLAALIAEHLPDDTWRPSCP